ncbi:C6 transcription factor [Penicillium sp. IBT 16267x]|nr:C6 transcription factor [Penicillium sp. IBT 16267x]
MSYNYSQPVIEDRSGFSDHESVLFGSEWATSEYSQLSLGLVANSSSFDGLDTRFKNAKVPIPRISTPGNFKASGRVSKACESCRGLKAKCSGHQPTCHRCLQAGIKCSYGDRKRERITNNILMASASLTEFRQLTDLTIQAQTYEGLLRKFHPRLHRSAAELVEQTLTNASIDAPNASDVLPLLFGSVFSLGAFDYTEEDVNHDMRLQSIGFIGEPSEMACLYQLKRRLDRGVSGTHHDQSTSLSHMNYFLDDTEIPVDEELDLSCWLSQSAADILVHHYFDVVHPTFPVIGKLAFLRQYRKFYSNSDPNIQQGKQWQAILNMIFAVAARQLRLQQGQLSVHFEDHSVYFSRAWHLSMDKTMSLNHPDLQQVQIEGLMALYMLSVGHINRSWRFIGVAIRSAITIGINLRSHTQTIATSSKETRHQLWWALIMFEIVLCEMTGRPMSTGANFYTTPLPKPYSEEDFPDKHVIQPITGHTNQSTMTTSTSSNSSTGSSHPGQLESFPGRECEPQPIIDDLTPRTPSHLLCTVELSLIMRDAITTLYAPTAAQRSWHEIKSALISLNDDADKWLSRLPLEFQFINICTDRTFLRQRTYLAFQFFSTKLVISQSCLRPLASSLLSEIKSVVTLRDNMATMCVRMASLILDILPDTPNATYPDYLPPWWSVFHYLMQATAVLMVQLFTRARGETFEAVGIIKNIRKAIRWLEMMSTRDPSSKRAWLVCMDLLTTHGSKLNLGVAAEN